MLANELPILVPGRSHGSGLTNRLTATELIRQFSKRKREKEWYKKYGPDRIIDENDEGDEEHSSAENLVARCLSFIRI